MSVSLFGLLWLIITIFFFFKSNLKGITILLFLSSIIQSNYVVSFGDQEIGSFLTTTIFFIIKSCSYNCSCCKIPNFQIFFLSFFSLIFLLLFSSLFLYEQDGLLTIIQILLYLLCAYRIYSLRKLYSNNDIISIVKPAIWFVVLVSPLQLLATFDYIPLSILEPFFYNRHGLNVYYHHPEIYRRLLSTFLEPSFCAPFLIGCIIWVYYSSIFIKRKLLLFLLLIELVLTMSSTGYLTMIIVVFLVFISSNYSLSKRINITLVSLILLGVLFYLAKDNLLREVIFEKMESNSGKFRAMQDSMALDLFYDNYWFGSGYGCSRASSMVTTLLAETGVIGFSFYLFSFLVLLVPFFTQTITIMEKSSRLVLVSVMISQMIAIPDLQYSVFWFGFYLFALLVGRLNSNGYDSIVLNTNFAKS